MGRVHCFLTAAIFCTAALSSRAEDVPPLDVLNHIKSATVLIKARAGTQVTSGTGFLVQVSGDTALVVTNKHVVTPPRLVAPPKIPMSPKVGPPKIEPPVRLEIVLNTGGERQIVVFAKWVAVDDVRGLVLLQVDNVKDLPKPLDLSANVELTETMPVFLIGFPSSDALAKLKGDPAIIVGKATVSKLHKNEWGKLWDIQIDGDLNAGHSGGPVVDAQGRLIGIAALDGGGTARAIPARDMFNARVGSKGMRVAKLDNGAADIEVRVGFVDPLNTIEKAFIRIAPASSVKESLQVDSNGQFPQLPSSQTVELKMENHVGIGAITLRSDYKGPVNYYFQTCFVKRDQSLTHAPAVSEPVDFDGPKVRSIAAGDGSSPPCLCWSEDAKAFYHLDGSGTVRRFRYPELTQEAAIAVGHNCKWISLSSEGLVATVRGAQEAWLLDPMTLKQSKRMAIGKAQYVVSSPKLALAYAAEDNPTGGLLTVLDLKIGKPIKEYRGSDFEGRPGFDHPVVSAGGQFLFATGSADVLYKYKLDGAEIVLAEATDKIIRGAVRSLSISNDGDFVCAPCAAGNIGASGKYATHIFASTTLKKPIVTVESGVFPAAIGFDFKSGLIYAHDTLTPLIVFDAKGARLKELALANGATWARTVQTQQFLVHPSGRQLLALCEAGIGSIKSEYWIFAVELPTNTMATSVDPAIAEIGAAVNDAMKLVRAGKFKDAVPLFDKAVRQAPKVYGEYDARTASLFSVLAVVYREQGMYAESESLGLRRLDIEERIHGKEHPAIANSLTNLAEVYTEQGKSAEAESYYLRALAIYERKFGKEYRSLAPILQNLAFLYSGTGRLPEAVSLCQRSLDIEEKALPKNDRRIAQNITSLATLYMQQGNYADAELLYKRSLSIAEKAFLSTDRDLEVPLNNLALVYELQGKLGEAESLYQRSLDINERFLGKEHPNIARGLWNLVRVYLAQKRFAEAAQLETRLRQSARQFLIRELSNLSVREQRNFLDKYEKVRFAHALSIGYSQAADAAILETSAAWLLNGKAIALEAQTIRSSLEREITDAEGRTILRDLQALRAQEAALALQTKQDETASKRREQLQARRHDLEKKLASHSSTAAKLANPWVELAEVRKRIPADGVLIDIARFPVTRSFAKLGEIPKLPVHYVAWVIPPAGAIRLVDLGNVAFIDAAIQSARKSLENTPERLEKRDSERNLEVEMAAKLNAVAKLVFAPLKPHLGKAKQLILSPDGDLWLLPWAALPTGQDRYLIEDCSLRFVVTGRDLIDYTVDTKPTTTAALILADPDYNLTPAEVAAAAPKQPSIPEGTLLAQTRGVSDELRGVGRVKRLPGTVAEAKQAFDKLKLLTGREPKLHMEGAASETIVKATKSPQVLVLATHGFFLKKQEIELTESGLEVSGEKKPAIVKDKEGKEVENPLLRCGLLLAGANKRAQAKDGEDDGILTGLEIVGLDLRGTQMVVLSACETGVGDVQTGEGVAGLRQAFQLAGAECVLSTLWQISDSATSQLMNTFYDELAKGTERSEALTRAQRQFLKERREKSGAAHPYFWASFTLTGK